MNQRTLELLPPDLGFYASPPHECSYLEDREAATLFVDPYAPMSKRIYSVLAEIGFRRSGPYVYRPRCPGCSACQSARIPAAEFQPNRSQRRTWNRNRDIEATVRDDSFREEHFELYRRYTSRRHTGGGMDVDSPEQYRNFLTSPWSDTAFVEFRAGGRLLGVSVTDGLDKGLSAVYTFFDPDEHKRGLGVFAILWQVEEARRIGLDWLYLGYWIKECPKMAYKANFYPLEVYIGGQWRRLDGEP